MKVATTHGDNKAGNMGQNGKLHAFLRNWRDADNENLDNMFVPILGFSNHLFLN